MDVRPVFGFLQPAIGFHVEQYFSSMKGKKKTPKVPGLMRAVLADNVKRFMDYHYRNSANRPMALAKGAQVSLSTVQRLLSKGTGASLDNIESIAGVFHLSMSQIMVRDLDPETTGTQGAFSDEIQDLIGNWPRLDPDLRASLADTVRKMANKSPPATPEPATQDVAVIKRRSRPAKRDSARRSTGRA